MLLKIFTWFSHDIHTVFTWLSSDIDECEIDKKYTFIKYRMCSFLLFLHLEAATLFLSLLNFFLSPSSNFAWKVKRNARSSSYFISTGEATIYWCNFSIFLRENPPESHVYLGNWRLHALPKVILWQLNTEKQVSGRRPYKFQ